MTYLGQFQGTVKFVADIVTWSVMALSKAVVTKQIQVPSDLSVASFSLKSWGNHSITAVTARWQRDFWPMAWSLQAFKEVVKIF